MWQKFTVRARKAVFFAQEEAQRFAEGSVRPEHLLLGLVREDCTAYQVLAAVGCDGENMSLDLRRQMPRGSGEASADMTLTPRAKRVIDLAYDESRNLNNTFIGTEHLLLALIRDEDNLAARVLTQHGVMEGQARVAVHAIQESRGIASESPPSHPPIRGSRPKSVTERELLHTRQMRYPLDRLALILLTEEGSATQFLRDRRIHPGSIQTSLEELMLVWPGRKELEITQSINAVLLKATSIAGGEPVTSAHILIAIAQDESSFLHYLLKDEGVDVDALGDGL
jgi:ATP-dependent Clp protease ATP-binding subunit ClpA